MKTYEIGVQFLKEKNVTAVTQQRHTCQLSGKGHTYLYQYTGKVAPVVGSLAVVESQYGVSFVEIMSVRTVTTSIYTEVVAIINYTKESVQLKELRNRVIENLHKVPLNVLRQIDNTIQGV